MLKLFSFLGRKARTPPSCIPTMDPAEREKLEAELTAGEAELLRRQAELDEVRLARREAEINLLASTLIAEGIPLAMIEEFKPLLLADTGAVVGKVKLASGGEKDATQTDIIVQSLRALPEFLRIKPSNSESRSDES